MSESSVSTATAGPAPDTTARTPAPPTAAAPANPTPPTPAVGRQLADAQRQAADAVEQRDQWQSTLDAVNKALTPDGNRDDQDPAALTAAVAERDKQLDRAAAELRTARVELAAYKTAADHGARADRLLNSRSFLDTVAALDPTDATFDEQLVAAIRAAVETDPDLYRATPAVPGRGGAEFNGAPAAPTKPATLRDAIAARLGA
ncbi:hypothetical protein [Streptomyces noursei]|uniref:hypothetical protein n=1 Tax=Streptomyces noursei TaxID=1971 RepID=UPI0030F27206